MTEKDAEGLDLDLDLGPDPQIDGPGGLVDSLDAMKGSTETSRMGQTHAKTLF